MMTSGKGGGKKALAAKPNLLNALRVQSSSYGQVMPIVYGQNRVSGRLLWSGDFTAIPHTSAQKVGGKGLGSGGGNAITNTTYTYQTAVAIGLCQGPIQNIHNVWDSRGRLTLVSTSQAVTAPVGGGDVPITPPGGGRFHSGFGASRQDAFSTTATDYGSDGTTTLTGTQQTPMTKMLSGSTLSAGQYIETPTPNGGVTYTFAAADAGKSVTITYVYSVPPDPNSSGQPQQKLNLTLFTGQRPQSPWTYLSARHAGQDLGYNGIAYVASSNLDLGESGTLPNLSFEVLGVLPFGGGITDAEPSAIISDLLNNVFSGMAGAVPLDNQRTGNTVAQYRNFCVANGIFLSPVLDAQRSAAEWIQDLLDITNAAAVWSEGLLKIVCYGDTTAVANGAIFTPATNPVYDLTTADLLEPVSVKRPSIADVKNAVSVEFVNRANDYNVDIAEDKDEAMISLYGLRKAEPKQAHSITTATVARFVANLLRKRAVEIRATYTFKLGWQFNLLEPMDLVTITVPELGYSKKPVRITAIREDDSGQLELDAEDFPFGAAAPTLYPHQPPGGFVPQSNADPGFVNQPMIFEANDRLSLSGNYEIWIGVCGAGPDWGGASVWVSPDNSNYTMVGRVYGPARMGVLTSQLVAAADPDTTHTLAVDLTQSSGVLLSGTQADCDNFRTLCWADGELISYEDATLTSAFHYDLGAHGSALAIAAAANASPIQVTAANHGFSSGETVVISGVGGNTAANGTWQITVVDANNFTLNGSAGNGAYTSGGTVAIAARLRRGVWGSPITTHNAGAPFVRLDNAIFVWESDPTLIGTTVYFKFTSFNKLGLMEQSLAAATAYPFVFKGLFGNSLETPANNATIDSVVNGSVARIRVYGPGGLGTSYSAWKQKDQGAVRSIPAQNIDLITDLGGAPQFSTNYWVSYDFNSQSHAAYANYNNYIEAVFRGQMRLGLVTTVSSSGGGGSIGGLGDSGTGGSGTSTGGRKLPAM